MKNTVWLASYPKSGNTWFRMFLANYQNATDKPLALEEISSTPISSNALDFEDEIGLNPFELYYDEIDSYRPELYRILSEESGDQLNFKKTHDAYTLNRNQVPLFPADISKCAIYFVRNPLDVCVSYANHSAHKIDRTLKLLLNEEGFIGGKHQGQIRQLLLSWKSHVNSWTKQTEIPVHIVRYEDMLMNPVESFGGIVRFLGLDYDQKRLEQAILFSDFKTLQKMENEGGFREKMQLCKHFFWKGKIGNYHEHLSKEQIQKIIDYNYDTMKEFNYIDENNHLTV